MGTVHGRMINILNIFNGSWLGFRVEGVLKVNFVRISEKFQFRFRLTYWALQFWSKIFVKIYIIQVKIIIES